MDPRLQHISENFENITIGLDEPFQFHCTQCGKCCIHREDILLNPQDLFRIAKHLEQTPQDVVEKDVHWYLMMADSYYSKPQREEYFIDSGYYKFYEAYHLLKFSNEKQILEKAYNEYLDLKKANLWGSKKYF